MKDILISLLKTTKGKSASGKFDATDIKNLAKESLYAGAAAALLYAMNHVSDIKVGENNEVIVAVLGLAISAVYKWFKTNVQHEEETKKE